MRGYGRRDQACGGSGLHRFVRLTIMQTLFLRDWVLMAFTLVLIAWPIIEAFLHAWAGLGNLLSLMIQYVEMILPLWALVASGLIWKDADYLHRPLLLSSSQNIAFILACKLAAVLIPFLGLVLLAEWELPRLYRWAIETSWGTATTWPFAPGLLSSRAMSVAIVFAALGTAGGISGFAWVGVTAGAVVWLLNVIRGVPWLKAESGGAFDLFALSRGGQYVPAATLSSFIAGAVIVAVTVIIASSTQPGNHLLSDTIGSLGRLYRFIRRQLPLLRNPGLVWTILGIFSIPLVLLILHETGRLPERLLIRGFCAFHEQWLPLVALMAGGTVWMDKEGLHASILASWPIRPVLIAATKSVIAFTPVAFLTCASSTISAALLGRLAAEELLPPAACLVSRSLAGGSVLLGLAAVGAAAYGSWPGLLLGAGIWILNAVAPGMFADTLGGALDLFAWSRTSYLVFPGVKTRLAFAVGVSLQLIAATIFKIASK
ncbi:MAG TPA: hypothetical protein GXX30_10995 [Firmicutes bacterium]|nr:hypothetical protein [Candidatus Fermentithermobacillaceae bacterium]